MSKETPVSAEPQYVLNTPQVRVRMQIQGKTQALFVFDRPSAQATRHYFSEVRPRFRSQGAGEIKMMPVERSHATDVLDKYLKQVLRVPELEPFEHEKGLEGIKDVLKQPRVQTVLFDLINNGVFGVEVMEPDDDDVAGMSEGGSPADDKLDFGSMFASQPIFLHVKEWDDEGLEQNHYLKVTMAEPSAVDQRALENAQPLIRKKKGDFEHQEDVGTCQRLFAARVQSIEGAFYLPMANETVAPKPCTAENRGEWLPYVPYQIVTSALAQEQAKGQLGNG